MSVTILLPLNSFGSHRQLLCRCEDCWLARRRSRRHSAPEERVSRLRRRDAKEFRARARPQPSFTAPHVRPSLQTRNPQAEAGQAGVKDAKHPSAAGGHFVFRHIAKCRAEFQQASQQSSQRRGRFLFESTPLDRHGCRKRHGSSFGISANCFTRFPFTTKNAVLGILRPDVSA
jgi:hypothetical protein